MAIDSTSKTVLGSKAIVHVVHVKGKLQNMWEENGTRYDTKGFFFFTLWQTNIVIENAHL
jgi:hypothetical protein